MDWYLGLLGQISANDRFRVHVNWYSDMDQHPYGWLSLLPPIVAIVLAILTRRVIISLLISVFVGAMILGYYSAPIAVNDQPSVWDLVKAGAISTWYDHLWPTLMDPDKVSVFIFTCMMGAIVGMVNRAAGMRGLIGLMSPIANSRVGVQISTWISGMFIFFDDYANTLLLGTTYRSAYDRLRVSREKLAYIVDSTAAPVAGLAIVSTWIAGELDYISSGLAGVTLANNGDGATAFELFVESIPYRFYVIWALFFVLLSAVMRRDFGPMLKAERRALAEEQHGPVEQFSLPEDLDWKRLPVSNDVIPIEMTEVVAVAHDRTLAPLKTPARSINAILPISITVVAILGLMYQSGLNNQTSELTTGNTFSEVVLRLGDIFGKSDSYSSLVWGSAIGLLFTWFWLSWQKIVPSAALMQASGQGAAHMIPALAILWLASTLSIMTGSEPSVAYTKELNEARAMAKTVAAAPIIGEAYAALEPYEKVAATLRLHKVPEPIIVDTLVNQYQDPKKFWDEVLQNIGDQSLGSGFYGRYLRFEGRQVDWDNHHGSGAAPKTNDDKSQQTPSVNPSSLDEATKRFSEPENNKSSNSENESAGEESATDKDNTSNSATGSNNERSAAITLWPTSLRRRSQDQDQQDPVSKQAENASVTTADETKSDDANQQPERRPGAGVGGGFGQGGQGFGGGAQGGGGGPPGGGMAAAFADSRADPDISKVMEAEANGLKFPFSDIRHRLHTGEYLSSVLLRLVGPADNSGAATGPHPFARWLPTLVFVLAAFTAFATGTSWGTMGIIMPLAIPLAGSLLSVGGVVDPHSSIFVGTIAGVLAGAIFGDHCSPISDTTVLSSNASGCDHLAHVWTQMPYAITVFVVSIVCGTIPIGFGVPWYYCLSVGTVALIGIMYWIGKPVEIEVTDSRFNQKSPQ